MVLKITYLNESSIIDFQLIQASSGQTYLKNRLMHQRSEVYFKSSHFYKMKASNFIKNCGDLVLLVKCAHKQPELEMAYKYLKVCSLQYSSPQLILSIKLSANQPTVSSDLFASTLSPKAPTSHWWQQLSWIMPVSLRSRTKITDDGRTQTTDGLNELLTSLPSTNAKKTSVKGSGDYTLIAQSSSLESVTARVQRSTKKPPLKLSAPAHRQTSDTEERAPTSSEEDSSMPVLSSVKPKSSIMLSKTTPPIAFQYRRGQRSSWKQGQEISLRTHRLTTNRHSIESTARPGRIE